MSVGDLVKDSQLSTHLQGAPTGLRREHSGVIYDASGTQDGIIM